MGILSSLESRATLTTTNPRDPVVAEWFGMGAQSAAGFSVTPDSAMRAAAVYSCIRVLSEAVASLPLIMYRRLPDGGKERATDHPLYQLVGRSPNSWQTRFEFIQSAVAHMCLRGASYSRIVADRKGKRQLIPLHPDRMRAEILSSGKLAYEFRPAGGNAIVLLQDEVLRVPFMVSDGVTPLSVITAQREAIGASLASQDYGSRFFANDARPTGGYITWETGNKFKDAEEEKKFRDNWQNYMTGPNRHKTAFMKPGMKFNELGMTNDDAQFLDTRKFQRSEIAGIFGVPPHMIGDLDRATFSNIEHQAIEFVVNTIGPWLNRWEQALCRDLLDDSEQDTYFFEFLTAGLLRGDATARANFYTAAITNGWMSRNEVRAIDNMNKVEGGDVFLVPMNMTSADQLGKDKGVAP